MSKFFLRFFLIVLIVSISVIIFLSYFGIETDKFDGLIKSKANEVNRYITIGFQKTKIHLNPTKLNLVVKLQNPKILVKDLRNNLENTDPESVLDGDINGFLEAALYQSKIKE